MDEYIVQIIQTVPGNLKALTNKGRIFLYILDQDSPTGFKWDEIQGYPDFTN